MEKTHVLVCRHWHKPDITIEVTNESISLKMDLDDFLKALAKEIGNPTRLVTNNQLVRNLLSSAEAVVKGMKRETDRVM